MKLTRKTILVMALLISVAMATTGTLAYLTDRDSEANVFTFGNVSIDLNEAFGQGATLVPGVNIEKKPVITNTGKNDAWVWMTFSIPSALDNLVQGTEQGSNENIIHWNPLGATTEGYVSETRVNNAIAEGHLPEGTTAAAILAANSTWNVFNSLGDGKNVYTEEIDGVAYNTYVLLYNKALTPGETTLPSIFKVFMDAQIDIDPNGDLYRVVKGNATPVDWNINTDGNPIIYVSAYAIQKDNFDTVEEAYAAYGKQWGDNGTEYGKPAVIVTTADEAAAVWTRDASNTYHLNTSVIAQDITPWSEYTTGNSYTVNGNGNTLTMSPSDAQTFDWIGGTIPKMSLMFSASEGADVIVKDLNIAGTMQSVSAGHYVNSSSNWYNTIFSNVNIINTKVVSFSAGISPALCVYGHMEMNDCNVYGTTLSPLDTDPRWPVYDVAAVNYSDLHINSSKVGSVYMWNQAQVTLNDGADVDTVVVRGNMNPSKYGLHINAGAKVGAIDLSAITNPAKINITIADSASVGKIIDDGNEYATIDAWKNAQ